MTSRGANWRVIGRSSLGSFRGRGNVVRVDERRGSLSRPTAAAALYASPADPSRWGARSSYSTPMHDVLHPNGHDEGFGRVRRDRVASPGCETRFLLNEAPVLWLRL